MKYKLSARAFLSIRAVHKHVDEIDPRLRCSALGNPKPVITWRRIDGNPLRIILKDGSTRKGFDLYNSLYHGIGLASLS